MSSPGEFVLRARQALIDGALRPAAVVVERGVIRSIEPLDAVLSGLPSVDLGDAVLLPGVVDAHVHINEPGRTEWEGFRTATQAAAAGGVTTLVDMPLNSIPPTTTTANLAQKRAAATDRCWVDVGFWGGAIPGNAPQLVELLDAGALGFKCFMVDSGVDEFPHVEERDLRAAMAVLADTGAPLLCHAELQGPIAEALARAGTLDKTSYAAYLASRPKEAEDEAIKLLVTLCRESRARVHVVHLSAASSLETLRRARDEGLPMSAETTPHYLHFSAETVPNGATPFKCAPPIRERANRESLWRDGLSAGVIDMVVSDHSPCTPELKRLETGDFEGAWGGIASLQLGLSVVWTEARARGFSLADVSRWTSEGPARLAGLSSRKGSISRGKDADFAVFRPEERFVVTPDRLLHRHPVTPYAGEELAGVVEATYVRGERVFDRGQVGVVPTGKLLSRESP